MSRDLTSLKSGNLIIDQEMHHRVAEKEQCGGQGHVGKAVGKTEEIDMEQTKVQKEDSREVDDGNICSQTKHQIRRNNKE